MGHEARASSLWLTSGNLRMRWEGVRRLQQAYRMLRALGRSREEQGGAGEGQAGLVPFIGNLAQGTNTSRDGT